MTIVFPLPRNRRLAIPLPRPAALAGWWTGLELAITLHLLHRGLWMDGSRFEIITTGAVWLVSTNLLDCQLLKLYSRKQLGLLWGKSQKTGWLLDWATLTAAGMLFSGLCFGTARGDYLGIFLFRKIGYVIGAFGQRFVEAYILVRLEKPFGKLTPLATSLLFCWAHSPNRKLMAIGFLGEYLSAVIFQRYRNLFSLGAAHGIIGAALPAFWRMNMRVGSSYLRR